MKNLMELLLNHVKQYVVDAHCDSTSSKQFNAKHENKVDSPPRKTITTFCKSVIIDIYGANLAVQRDIFLNEVIKEGKINSYVALRRSIFVKSEFFDGLLTTNSSEDITTVLVASFSSCFVGLTQHQIRLNAKRFYFPLQLPHLAIISVEE
jgi:hypothetical protein